MNLPNKLTILRICMVPLFVVAYFLPYFWGAFVAVALFALAAFTDFLDGYIARKYNLVTDLGKLLDPIADKVLVCAALFCVVATNPLQFIGYSGVTPIVSNSNAGVLFGRIYLSVGGVIIIARELLISAVRMIAGAKGIVVQANIYGKIKTIFQDISLPILVILNACTLVDVRSVTRNYELYLVGWWTSVVLFGVSVVLTVVSCVIYLVQNKKVFSS